MKPAMFCVAFLLTAGGAAALGPGTAGGGFDKASPVLKAVEFRLKQCLPEGTVDADLTAIAAVGVEVNERQREKGRPPVANLESVLANRWATLREAEVERHASAGGKDNVRSEEPDRSVRQSGPPSSSSEKFASSFDGGGGQRYATNPDLAPAATPSKGDSGGAKNDSVQSLTTSDVRSLIDSMEYVTISTTPPRAMVSVSGQAGVFASPTTLMVLPGKYTIHVEREQYKPVDVDCEVPGDDVQVTLQRL